MDEKYLVFIVEIEKRLKRIGNYFRKGFKFGVLYDLWKTHKKVLQKCPSFRPILSPIKTSSYNLAKFLVSLSHINLSDVKIKKKV